MSHMSPLPENGAFNPLALIVFLILISILIVGLLIAINRDEN